MLADDHRMLREGLRRSMTEQGFDVVGEARDGREAIRLAEELRPEVILMDVTMPEVDGIEATRQIKQLYPDMRIVRPGLQAMMKRIREQRDVDSATATTSASSPSRASNTPAGTNR